MANGTVDIDRVYQKVLALANKEQRGYITPQEFNLFADQAQFEIFENYFHDIKIARLKPTNDSDASDELSILRDKISIHRSDGVALSVGAAGGANEGFHLISSSTYVITRVYKETGTVGLGILEFKEVDLNDLANIMNNELTAPRVSTPIYVKTSHNKIKIYPTASYSTTANIKYDVIIKPEKPVWGYVVVNNKALNNPATTTDFDLHESEENNLVMRILELSGIAMKETELVQIAARDRASTKAEKNN